MCIWALVCDVQHFDSMGIQFCINSGYAEEYRFKFTAMADNCAETGVEFLSVQVLAVLLLIICCYMFKNHQKFVDSYLQRN